MAEILIIGGFFLLVLLAGFIFTFFFMSNEDWDELNKYYEEQNNKGKQGDVNVGSTRYTIYKNWIGGNWFGPF
jgi:hypothetical protein